ncbi:hypothetical protein CLU79DRAFT_694685 [Phycomyces nitens]|nr:hypothetical protein CLU79DRAFT_694685 [Phycomyces nitens]
MEDRSLLVLYGSETGCAQDVAETISRQGKRRHFRTRVSAMDEYDKANLVDETLVIFVCSTTGQGDEPNNMKKFWRFLLRKNLPHDILNGLNCAVFGLGDSSYQKFNYPAKKLYKRLIQLGANMIHSRGDGDDQHYMGLDGELIPWLKELWDNVDRQFPLPKDMTMIPEDILYPFYTHSFALISNTLPPSFHIQFIDEGTTKKEKVPESYSEAEFDVVVKANDRITAIDHFQDVRHIVLHNDSSLFTYEAGDTVSIMPQNLADEINQFLEQVDWAEHADRLIKIVPADPDRKIPTHWPETMTFRDLFVYQLDVCGVPRRSFFEILSYFTTDPNHTERLREFTRPEGQDDMYAYCQRPRRTIAEILFDFKPFDIPLDYILDIFPPLQPRSYSIASSIRVHPNEMHLCIAIVKYKTKMRKIRRGVLTKWISTLVPGDIIKRVHLSKGSMNLPSPSTPYIAIGPGTGIAPIRSFLEERVLEHAKSNVLFVGCRNSEKDFLYGDRWKSYVADGYLTLFTAFSRDQDEKIYVQDRLRENSSAIWDLVHNQHAKVMLCGSSDKMPAQVAFAFKQIFMKEGGLDSEEAEGYFNMMIKTKQYQEECWA